MILGCLLACGAGSLAGGAGCGKASPVSGDDLATGSMNTADLAPAPVDGDPGAVPDLVNPVADLTAAKPAPPLIDLIKGHPGSVEIGWTNGDPACDMNEGWRKWALESYKQIFSVAGNVTRYTDSTATMTNTNYTFRVRCLKGGVYSDWSNEESAAPQ